MGAEHRTRVVFMGTPEFAVPALSSLIERYSVVGVVTQPDREAGRGRPVIAPPVKQLALQHGIPVLQPRTLRTADAVAQLEEWAPDIIVVAAFGQILRPDVLDLPLHGCLNLHASLLPRHRGANPIASAILDGDPVTGVTIMKMDAGLDTGPILAQREEPIRPDDTSGRLSRRLAQLGARLLMETLPRWLAGEIVPQPQNPDLATYRPLLTKEDGRIDWSDPAAQIERQVRAYDPWPGSYTAFAGQMLRVISAEVGPDRAGEPGTAIAVDGWPAVICGQGTLMLRQVQLAGRTVVSGSEFLRGQRHFVGSRLG